MEWWRSQCRKAPSVSEPRNSGRKLICALKNQFFEHFDFPGVHFNSAFPEIFGRDVETGFFAQILASHVASV